MRYDVCIVGGGAAGLIAAARLDDKIKTCIIDGNEIPGRKILATGGGRCNMTNSACPNKEMSLGFFAYLGIETHVDEEGRYYPYSNRASDIVDCLIGAMGKNVHFKLSHKVASIAKTQEGYRLTCIHNKKQVILEADRVILACGGKAGSQFGTKGDGYAFARSLGHSTTRIFPILTGMEVKAPEAMKWGTLKGIRCRARVQLLKDEKPIAKELGELQFTDYGLSGICIFNLTPYVNSEEGENFSKALSRFKLSVDFAPDFDEEQLVGRKSAFGILTGNLAKAVEATLKEGEGIDAIKHIDFNITGIRGWKEAQSTSGGVKLDEISLVTMESKIQDKLYFAGEILDVQGPCGGYNLQNAWETGLKAAEAINREIQES